MSQIETPLSDLYIPDSTHGVSPTKQCQFCPNPTAKHRIVYQLSYTELCKSADAGCASCSFLRDGIVGILEEDSPAISRLSYTVTWMTADDDDVGSAPRDGRIQSARISELLRIGISFAEESRDLELYTDNGTPRFELSIISVHGR